MVTSVSLTRRNVSAIVLPDASAYFPVLGITSAVPRFEIEQFPAIVKHHRRLFDPCQHLLHAVGTRSGNLDMYLRLV